jgi:hypothetical protein
MPLSVGIVKYKVGGVTITWRDPCPMKTRVYRWFTEQDESPQYKTVNISTTVALSLHNHKSFKSQFTKANMTTRFCNTSNE